MFLIPKSTPGKVRPIALASCLFKCLEKMVYFRLSFFIEHNISYLNFNLALEKTNHV